MSFKPFISLLALAVIIFASVAGSSGCANVVPPQGGPRDSIPPVITKLVPADSSINFTGNRINFTFDEYIDIDNFQQNAIISPIPKVFPSANRRLNTLTVRLRDSLEPNTTYSIDFGNAIKDVNEGNAMKNYTYVFATGPHLDSLSFSGKVIVAESGKTDTSLLVILHKKSEDSALIKEKPRYMTRLNGKGAFIFRNLPAGTFYVYAMKDDSRTFRYLNDKQLFAFADSPIVVQKNTPPITLYAYQGTKGSPTTPASTGQAGSNDKRLKFQTSLKNSKAQDLLQKFSLIFEKPLKRFDSTKIHISSDSAYKPVTGYSWSLDSTRKKLTLNYTWQENTLYHFVLEKDFAADTLNYQLLKADTITFKTMKNGDYGKLVIRFRNLDLTKNPVLEFVQNDEVMSTFSLTGDVLTQDVFLPGDYDLRLLNDVNKNGVWDPGVFFGKHKQPETVKPIDRKLTIKANWDNEVEINL